jgi:AraC family transcriptional regulator of adaptative response/methylated-DNA-[protein]-cysteine methyltransferase
MEQALNRIVTMKIASPLGNLIAGATDQGVCLLEFADRRILDRQLETLHARFDAEICPGTNDHLALLNDEVAAYFDRRLKAFTVSIVTRGTPFEERVWTALRKIPYGTTSSYESIARAIGGSSGLSRAVGHANGMNRIAIVIPCHRVIAKDGALTGYGGGLWRKERLLALEGGEQPLLFER